MLATDLSLIHIWGADVTLVSGPTAIAPPPFVTVVPVVSAQDMFEAVAANAPKSDFIFKAAAVADYTPANYSDNKVKKSEGDMSIPLKRTRDLSLIHIFQSFISFSKRLFCRWTAR